MWNNPEILGKGVTSRFVGFCLLRNAQGPAIRHLDLLDFATLRLHLTRTFLTSCLVRGVTSRFLGFCLL